MNIGKRTYKSGNAMCCECICPIPDCPWMSSGKPVPGWDAEIAKIKFSGKYDLTYAIKSCPLFKPHPRSTLFDKNGRRIRANY